MFPTKIRQTYYICLESLWDAMAKFRLVYEPFMWFLILRSVASMLVLCSLHGILASAWFGIPSFWHSGPYQKEWWLEKFRIHDRHWIRRWRGLPLNLDALTAGKIRSLCDGTLSHLESVQNLSFECKLPLILVLSKVIFYEKDSMIIVKYLQCFDTIG